MCIATTMLLKMRNPQGSSFKFLAMRTHVDFVTSKAT
jgi:hypothetical protein